MNVEEILFRCSSNGYLMIEPQGKSNAEKLQDAYTNLGLWQGQYDGFKNKETATAKKKLTQIENAKNLIQVLEPIKDVKELSETTKTHLVDKFVSIKYQRETDLYNRYLEKGNACEDDSITLYSRITKTLFIKNEEMLSNKFICGTPDLYEGESISKASVIVDVKTSWDVFTFNRIKYDKEINKMYFWQLQGYMALTGAKVARLAYCLVNAPDYLIDDEKRKFSYRHGLTPEALQEGYKRIERNMIFDIDAFSTRYPNYQMANETWKWDIPKEERMHEITIERNEADIAALYEKITFCRNYLKTLYGI